MKPVYYHYTLWEDFQHGMYNEDKDGRNERVKQAVSLLSNRELLFEYMTRVANEWKYAVEQTFTNPGINHQAFLGQTACCLYAGIKEDETREAWGLLQEEQRHIANQVADRVYDNWVRNYESENSGKQMTLFEH